MGSTEAALNLFVCDVGSEIATGAWAGKVQRKRKSTKSWETYEEVALHVVDAIRGRFRISDVQGKQMLKGHHSGTQWEVEGKAVSAENGIVLLIECRRYTSSRLNQEAVGAVAYRIRDTAVQGAILVSPMPLQKGARMVAKANNINHVMLEQDSTKDSWVAKINEMRHFGETIREATRMSDSVEAEVIKKSTEIPD